MMTSLWQSIETLGYDAIDRGLIPDFILRPAIRFICRQRLSSLNQGSEEERHERKMGFIEGLRGKPVAIEQTKANEQHYEVPTEFIKSCLGSHMKYSCCLFLGGQENLDQGEVLMLEDYCGKAKLKDGMKILDLGCGWGSLCLYLAQKYPKSQITALSNSRTQKVHIDSLAQGRQLSNLNVVTGDVMSFDFPSSNSFDRILSIEMLEHMKNYEFLFKKVSTWLNPDGLFFAHVFCHTIHPYHFESDDGWMAQNFFSGGTMPSLDLFAYFQRDLVLEKSWYINGKHYGRTSELWLKQLDANAPMWLNQRRKDASTALNGKFSTEQEIKDMEKTFYRFRTFFIAVAEFFALDDGKSWGVAHYVFKKKSS
ncbi:uncharacterized protein MELLADRAFT_87040 [Melampsora larici-populina 98AG31]|uniref:S-adenosyl-L-methionine-dependent methyltransferase n=1 Tax=Melampsora larici-populina (strain 98AG31 / pathotype 3-4-7) TaxID=747676 RepID=F4R4A9_MELLP|nr:uncharacterized protein MELLADRAFT_87040 [Melampsora larici-populina 98AG31]EGG12778.1 hypothetical protein MELLADRAFT_87040 [Melampsora larici-populina 98AG31]